MKKILAIASIASLVLLVGILGFTQTSLASSLPLGGQTYFLSGAGITSTQNTIQLTSFDTADGTPITMSNFGTEGYATLEPQSSAKVEFVNFTGITQNGNGTATLTGVTRGVGFIFPYTSTASLMKAHAGGASFIISNTPQFYYNEFAMPGNSNVFVYPSASSSVATKGYVDSVAFGNVPQASTIAVGVVQLATALQTASSTGSGSAGPLVIPASLATSTYNPATAPLRVVVTQNSGKIDNNFIATSTLGLSQSANLQVFTSTTTPGTWTKTTGAKIVCAYLIAGGAGGNGGLNGSGSGGNSGNGGTGGGSGGYTTTCFDATTLPGTMTVTIGAGGAGGTAPGGTGTNGTNTTFGSFLNAIGGKQNTASAGFVSGTIGGAGGVGTGGSSPGSAGTASFWNSLLAGGAGGAAGTIGGVGVSASSTLPYIGGTGGGGGQGVSTGSTGGNGGAGAFGGLYGAGGGGGGGGGAGNVGAGLGAIGGQGADGIADIVTYF